MSPSPVISVVMPCVSLLTACLSMSRLVSDWPSMSMKPGATIRPLASMVRLATSVGSALPTKAMRSPMMPTSA